jgi:hypothetical protein
VGAVLIRP